jgi:hypothetical protein
VVTLVRIGFQAKASDARVLKELLSPWDISFTSPEQADIVIVYDCEEAIVNKAIVVPHDRPDFLDLLRELKLRLEGSFHEPIQVAVSPQTTLTIWPERFYSYGKPAASTLKEDSSAELTLNDELSLLKVDVLNEYKKIMKPILDAKSSTLYSLLTSLPIRYDAAPKKIRDFVMRGKREEKTFNYCDKLPLDALRFIVAGAVERLSGKRLSRACPPQKTWNRRKYACFVTHDIDTSQGLRRAHSLKKIEEKYDVPSAWYIPSDHFRLDTQAIRELANHGEVGSHDTKHDGKLAQLSQKKLVRRLYESKKTLSKAANCSIEGFRAPLLQHSLKIIDALRAAGYSYDTSIPTWEPKHPTAMGPHGIGTVYPMTFDGIVEIPVTLPQDHQMMHVLGIKPDQTVEVWIHQMKVIKEIGGICVLLLHPDYELGYSENLPLYEELLNSIKDDDDYLITLPRGMVNHV